MELDYKVVVITGGGTVLAQISEVSGSAGRRRCCCMWQKHKRESRNSIRNAGGKEALRYLPPRLMPAT